MKKYILGIASAIIGIALSAFNNPILNQKDNEAITYKWFTVSYSPPYQATGAILMATDLPFGNTLQTRDFALNNDGCEDAGSKNCLRGFVSGSEPIAFPSTALGNSQTPKPE